MPLDDAIVFRAMTDVMWFLIQHPAIPAHPSRGELDVATAITSVDIPAEIEPARPEHGSMIRFESPSSTPSLEWQKVYGPAVVAVRWNEGESGAEAEVGWENALAGNIYTLRWVDRAGRSFLSIAAVDIETAVAFEQGEPTMLQASTYQIGGRA